MEPKKKRSEKRAKRGARGEEIKREMDTA